MQTGMDTHHPACIHPWPKTSINVLDSACNKGLCVPALRLNHLLSPYPEIELSDKTSGSDKKSIQMRRDNDVASVRESWKSPL